MVAELFLALLLGIFIGIFTGLIPGIHVNLVSATLFAISPFLLNYISPLSLGVFIISLSVTHSFLDTIPSIYLGAPENENALSILPGQKMLLMGEGHQAIKITILGTFTGMIAAILLIPLFMLTAKNIFSFLKPYLLYLLVAIICYMILKEKKKIFAILVFLLSGTLGVIVLSIGMKEPLFPMLSGLFGLSGLFLSYFEITKIPRQEIDNEIRIKFPELLKAIIGSSIGVFFIQFFPGMGPAQGAVISSQLIRDIKDKTYLALVGAMGTMSVVFSLVTFYTLGKAKDGSIVILSKIMEVDMNSFIILISAMVIAGCISVFLVFFFSRVFSEFIAKVNYRMLVLSIIGFIFFMSLVLNGFLGVIILITAAAIGMIAPLTGIGRNHAMGCLLVPVVIYLL